MDSVLFQKQVRDNAEDLKNYLQELKSWETDMKRKETELKASTSSDMSYPPVRSKMKKVSKEEKIHEKFENKEKRISGFDYSSWDKFDVDKACEDVDKDQQNIEIEDEAISDIEKERLREEALYEKGRGNDFVKDKKWKQAIQCYSRAISCYPYDAIFYANRGLCYLKTADLRSAETDCTTALQLDHSYVKAYQRRASARVGLGQFEEARNDLLKVLEIEPKNTASKSELIKLEKKIESNTTQKSDMKSSNSTDKDKLKFIQQDKETEVVISQTSNNKNVSPTEVVKKAKSTANHNIKVQKSDVSRFEEDVSLQLQTWHSKEEEKELAFVKPVYKSPHLRSKQPLKRIVIEEVDNRSIGEHMKSDEIQNAPLIESGNVSVTDDIAHKTQQVVGDIKAELKLRKDKQQSQDVMKISDQVPPAPQTSVQFLVTWKKVRSSPIMRYMYLKQIPSSDFPKIFGESLESNVLSDIIDTIKSEVLNHKDPALQYLKSLSNVRRFNTLIMFLSEDDKAGLRIILDHCSKHEECTEEEIVELKGKYEI